jgi:hypothetical protein
MPRRDYLKYFAKDEDGAYIGSEPYKKRTEEELKEEFAKYRPQVGKKWWREKDDLDVSPIKIWNTVHVVRKVLQVKKPSRMLLTKQDALRQNRWVTRA